MIEIVYRDFSIINEIYSPSDRDEDGQYDNKLDTVWMIFSNPNQVLYLEILNIDIQYGENCEYDSLQVGY